MNLRHHAIVGFGAMAIGLAGAASAATDAPTDFGLYRLDPARSSQSTGPLPKRMTVVREDTPDGVVQTTIAVLASGANLLASYTSRHDGAYGPATGNAPFDQIEVTQVDANTVTDQRRKTGTSYAGAGRTVFTDHGHTMTVTITGVSADGRPYSQRLVFEKQ